MDTLQQNLQQLDAQVEARSQAIRADHDWWPCRRGCDRCCRQLAQPPALSAAEWHRVDAAIAELPIATRNAIEQKIKALLLQIAEDATSSPVVCPYLNESEGACSIYEARPIACRTYGFFVAHNHDQICQLIEAEIVAREEPAIVWGYAEAIRLELESISGAPISFDVHYCSRLD